VKEILKDIVDKNLAQSFFDHFGGGKYDFKINEPNATFDVFGTTMNSGEFGNFLAGFAGQVNGGDLGVAGVRIGGVVYDFTDTLTYNALTAMGYTPPLPPGTPPPTFDFDADSKPAIDAGVELGEKLSPPPLYLPPGYMRHPLFPSTIVGPMGEEMTEDEARGRFSA
jgi:hypothetical protein